MTREKVLICGVLPPPNFGHSIMYQMLMRSSFPRSFDTKFLDLHFWSYGTHKKVTIEKLFKMVKYYAQLLLLLIFWRPKYVLYNSSFYPLPFLKDLLFCGTVIVLGSKLVIHDHGQYVRELDESLSGWKKQALRWKLQKMHASIIMGEKVRQDYEGLADQKKIFVVPGTVEDTINIKVEAPKEPAKINVLYFSYMSRLKGIYTTFEAVPMMLEVNSNIMVTFGGPLENDEVKNELEALQRKYPSRVRYMGYVEDVVTRTKIFRQADIFIFPTNRDVFGLVLLHAMAESLPIVASREGTIPEIVPDGTNALLLEKGNAKALAEQVLLLTGNEHLRIALGVANRHRFEEKYTLEKYGETMVKVFEKMENL